MKMFAAATIAAFVVSTSVQAGNLVFEAPVEEEVMEEEEMAPMGSSAAGWLVPLLAIVAIGIAASSDDDSSSSSETVDIPATDGGSSTDVD